MDSYKNQKDARKDLLDFALGMMIIGGSLSFNLIESEFFKKFVNLLDPAYKIPCRQTLSTTILNKVHEKISSALKPKGTEMQGTLMIDGWRNSVAKKNTVTARVKPAFAEEIFLKSYDFSAKSENHENLLEVIDDAGALAKQRNNVEVTSCVTDNASNMLKTGRESNLISYGCKAHTGNLYLNDVFDKLIYEQVHEIMVCFRKIHLQQCVKDFGGKSIYLAGETRWKVCIECF